MQQGRRDFLAAMVGGALMCDILASGASPAFPVTGEVRARDVIDAIVKAIPGAPREGSVDTFKVGDPSQAVSGIVTTFMATCAVIRKTVSLGANLIITHEPTFYNHRDEVGWLKDDPVYQFKRDLLERNQLVVWRFHDYWHLRRPDGILSGMLRVLDWEKYADPKEMNLCRIPPRRLRDLALFLKERFRSPSVRVVGDPDIACENIVLMPGAAGGRPQITTLSREDVDVVVCGEVNEWETNEYARDARFAGLKKGLVILGHEDSEEVGMKYLVEWLTPLVPGVKITHVPAGDPFTYL